MEEVELSIFGVGGGIAVAEDLPSGEFASVEHASGRVSVDSDDARYSVIAGDFSDSVTVSFEGIDCSNETTTTGVTTSTSGVTTTTDGTPTSTEATTTTTEDTTTSTSELQGSTTTSTTGITSTTGTTAPGSTTSTTKTETSLIPPISTERDLPTATVTVPTVPKSGGATPIKGTPKVTG